MISSYTVTVYELQESGFNFELNEYPIFDEAYRPVLNQAILDEYKFREIGFENPIMWRDRLKHRLSMIMRNKYNALYKAKMTDFNPLYNVDMTETFTHTVDNTNKNNSLSTSTSTSEQNNDSSTNEKYTTSGQAKNYSSSFPNTPVNSSDYENDSYIDNAQHNDSTGKDTTITDVNGSISSSDNGKNTNTQDGTSTTVETYTRHNLGSSAGLPFSKALIQLKEFFDKYELDAQVCAELHDLFINVYDI